MLRSIAPVLNGSFPLNHIKIPGTFFREFDCLWTKTAKHLKRVKICAGQGKRRRNPLWIASTFDADRCKATPFQAMLRCGVSPISIIFLCEPEA